MKYVDEFRDPARVRALVAELRQMVTRPWTVMEVCGGQTHTIARYALEDVIPDALRIVHGPGCPVCVTPLGVIDGARAVCTSHGAILCSFGDMLRVPGSGGDLLDARARGADVRIVHTPLQAVDIARAHPDREVVLLAVGFETTAPATAMVAEFAVRQGVSNLSLLASHVRVPPAIELILSAPDCGIDGFLAAGHVCTVAGTGEYPQLAARFGVPMVVTGFEPVDILRGLRACVVQLEAGRAEVENCYPLAVAAAGNPAARSAVERVFRVADRPWRGIGVVPGGGLAFRSAYAAVDAAARFGIDVDADADPGRCRAASVLTGRMRPTECPEFGVGCTPERPLGAPMVSTEGACAAYVRYRAPREREAS